MIGTENNYYPGFELPASALSAFAFSVDTFVISKKSGEIIHFTPKDVDAFKSWLIKHKIRDISVDKGFREDVQDILSVRKKRRI